VRKKKRKKGKKKRYLRLTFASCKPDDDDAQAPRVTSHGICAWRTTTTTNTTSAHVPVSEMKELRTLLPLRVGFERSSKQNKIQTLF
jgi:hypothetical protein